MQNGMIMSKSNNPLLVDSSRFGSRTGYSKQRHMRSQTPILDKYNSKMRNDSALVSMGGGTGASGFYP
jgi:hypothetical protein